MNVTSLKDVESSVCSRITSTWDEVDWFYGYKNNWGLPKGKISLWSSAPGIGKTRVFAEMIKRFDQRGMSSLIFQGEVSPAQFRGEKLAGYIPQGEMWISPEEPIDDQVEIIRQYQPAVAITESVQQIEKYPGDQGVKEIIRKLRGALEAAGTHLFLTSHLTPKGSKKNRNQLIHEVDVACWMNKFDPLCPPLFTLSCEYKNRYGETNKGRYDFGVVFCHKDWGVECQSEHRFDDPAWPGILDPKIAAQRERRINEKLKKAGFMKKKKPPPAPRRRPETFWGRVFGF